MARFNPPGGFGAFGTLNMVRGRAIGGNVSIRRADLGLLERLMPTPLPVAEAVSIRRADLGLLEHGYGHDRAHRNDDVSIRRADLGLLEPGDTYPSRPNLPGVSIRRADLGLLEPMCSNTRKGAASVFQSAGRIWGFWNIRDGAIWIGLMHVSIRRADLGLLER